MGIRLFSLSFLSPLSIAILLLPAPAATLPLSTDSRWIVDQTGRRVKLACVNWASHLEPVVAEGLGKQPVDMISKQIASMGFNCVRLTWPLFLATNESLANLTVTQSFTKLGLLESLAGFRANNPSLIHLSLINLYQAVVSSLANNNVMVIMDNHISKPGWCCDNDDGSGFFGDRYFNPDLWIKGLTRMATMFKDTPNVVGMSLRNELRGNKSNVNDWYRYMQKGAEAVHAANPNVLIILSGLSYSKDLSFLLQRPVNLTFTGKLVFEVHWYSFSDAYEWGTGNPNQVCAQIVGNVMRRAGFVVDQLGYPLFVSEFGVDQRGINVNDNRYLNCFMAVAAELDWEWALWTLAGSYYLREGGIGVDEAYGILNWNWCEARNSSFLDRISAIQSPFRGPGVSEAKIHQVIFHPLTGLCVLRQSLLEAPKLGPCAESDAWSYSQRKTLTIKGTYFCLQADALGKPAKLSIFCSDSTSKWEQISDSKMHLSSQLNNGTMVCLDVDPGTNIVITNSCKCLSRGNTCDPGSQWFKIVDSTRSIGAMTSFNRLTSVLDFFLGKNILGGLIV